MFGRFFFLFFFPLPFFFGESKIRIPEFSVEMMLQCCSSRDTDECALGQKQRIRECRQSISWLQELIATSQAGASRDPRENLKCVALKWFPLAEMLRLLVSRRYPILPLGNSDGQLDHRLIDVLSSLVAWEQPQGTEESQQSRHCLK